MKGKNYANRKPENERPLNDFYPTPSCMVRALIENDFFEEFLDADIYDPCCGKYAIGNVLREYGFKNITECDLIYGQDFLADYTDNVFDIVVMNPPFKSFDAEKDPMFFLDLCEACPDTKFVLVNPRKDRAISNDNEVVERLQNHKPKNLEIVPTYEKKDYYQLLARARIVFNCAHQDWVSWTLLEAITFHCIPLYPIWKDFPLELKNNSLYLYKKQDLQDARQHLQYLMKMNFDDSLRYVVKKHDNSWNRYLEIMGEKGYDSN